MNPIVPVILFFLNISPPIVEDHPSLLDTSSYSVYLVKQRWHTGIVFEKAKVDTNIWKEISHFKDKNWIDVGWGDKDFYQHPGFDVELAVKALFYPTESTLRVEGFSFSIERYIEISDIAVRINLTKEKFDTLCRYISETYERDVKEETVIYNEMYDGNIKYYKSKGNYHLFNTCNTWIAEGLYKINIEISDTIILAEQLFNAAQEFGVVLKGEK